MTEFHFAETSGAEGAPLVFTFHGTGGSETQFHGVASQLVPGAHVISPRGDVSENGMARFFRRTGEGVYDMDDLARRTEAMGDFMAAQIARTGASEVIGLGYSNGANILAAVAITRPDLCGKLVLMHPLIPWTPEPQPALRGVEVLVTAGRRDPICPADRTQSFADWLVEQGVSLSLAWHDGGHEIAQHEVEAISAFLAD